jgi:ATP-dependent Clp protease protease subunit
MQTPEFPNPLGGESGGPGQPGGGPRTVVISKAVTDEVVAEVSQQLLLLDAEGDAPIRVMWTSGPGGDADAAFSLFDLQRSLTARVIGVGSGRIQGASVWAFLGPRSGDRYALPHVRFELDEPRSVAGRGDVQREAERLSDLRDRCVDVLAEETGQSRDAVAHDLKRRRTLDAGDAATYGLVTRVVRSAREIE